LSLNALRLPIDSALVFVFVSVNVSVCMCQVLIKLCTQKTQQTDIKTDGRTQIYIHTLIHTHTHG